MTDTIPETIPTDTWAAELAQLRARYKHVREPILVALNILLHDENISLEGGGRRLNRGAPARGWAGSPRPLDPQPHEPPCRRTTD